MYWTESPNQPSRQTIDDGRPTGTEHENVGQNPVSSHPETRTGLNLCSLCVQLEDSQKKSPQNSAQGKCLLKFSVSPLFCKAGGSEMRNLVKVKKTSKRNFPNKT